MRVSVVSRTGEYVEVGDGEARSGTRTVILGAYTDPVRAEVEASNAPCPPGWRIAMVSVDSVAVDAPLRNE